MRTISLAYLSAVIVLVPAAACGQRDPSSQGFTSQDGGPPIDEGGAPADAPDLLGDASSSACATAAAAKSAVGCDFFTIEPDAPHEGSCFAAFISNGGSSDVALTLDFGGVPIKNFADFARIPSGSGPSLTYGPLGGSGNVLPAGKVAILFLAGSFDPGVVPCPAGISPAFTSTGDAALHGTGIGTAFHITTDNPVTAYDIYPYGGGTSAVTAASLLIPTSAWAKSYIAVDAYERGPETISGSRGKSWIAIVGMEDETLVTIRPTVNIVGAANLPAAAKDTATTYSVDRGKVLQFVQEDELVGSPIESTKPVGLIGGHVCMNVPFNATGACDSAHQQIPPVNALGHEYVVARYRDRYPGKPESPPVRIVGAVDGTILTYDPAPPSGAPQILNGRQMVQFEASDAFTVRSQDCNHPFYVAAYMTGATAYEPLPEGSDQWLDARGDPEFVNVVTPEQYAGEYVFFTDPTYPETELVVVRKKSASGFAEVKLECLGGNVTGWTDVGNGGTYQYTRVDLVTGNFEKQGNCDNGQHRMSSAAPFGVTVWGWGSAATGGSCESTPCPPPYSQWVSYAYPAGMSIAPINSVVVR
jgi:hypothetical protein